jgi:catechol 2,3-dioxygenase-like lactoylglutathione lyase family enzyme
MSEEINDVVRAKRFELMDDEGQVRAFLDTGPADEALLTFYESDGEAFRVSLGINQEGTAQLNLFDNQKTSRVQVATQAAGKLTLVTLSDEFGMGRVQLSLFSDGRTGLAVSDQWGVTRATFQVTEDGQPGLYFHDEDGNLIEGGSDSP